MGKEEINSIELYEKGKKITEDLEKYSEEFVDATGEEKQKLNDKIEELKEEKNRLKDEIYEQAKEKSGLDYSQDDKNPEFLRKKYNEEIQNLKKRKQELRLEKIRIEKLRDTKKEQMKEQFEIAKDKYKTMLDAGKITSELYENRIQNMEIAKKQNELEWSQKLYDINEEADAIEDKINGVKGKLKELEQKEIIYNEYADFYYRLFGEVLVNRNKPERNISIDENVESKGTSEPKDVSDVKFTSKTVGTLEPKNVSEDGVISTTGTAPEPRNVLEPVVTPAPVASSEPKNVTKKQEEKESKIVIESKSDFNDLYKKMKKGTISDNELNALAHVLANPDNYDKYGITTGIVFNKAKKILKYQGERTASNIGEFLRENGFFNSKIKYDVDMEKDGALSHQMLKSWKEIEEGLTNTESTFGVEKYISQIEKYKEDGNRLTPGQERMYKKALEIKENLAVYKNAINANREVTESRYARSRTSSLYHAIKNKFKSEGKVALPEKTSKEEDRGFVVGSFDLSSMVKGPEENEVSGKTEFKDTPVKVKDADPGISK